MEQNRDQIEFVYGRFAGQKQRGADLRSHPEINYPNFTRIDAAHRRSPGDQASVRLQALIGWTGPHRDLGWPISRSPTRMARRSASVSFGSSLMISDALTPPSII